MHAWREAQIPLPPVLSQCSYIVMTMTCIVIPFLVEKFTVSIVFSALLTFGTVFGLIMIHVVTNALEIPFGEEFMDLLRTRMNNIE